MSKVLGIKYSKGVYEGNAYENYIFHICDKADKPAEFVGSATDSVKVKKLVLDTVLSVDSNLEKISGLVGADVNFYYNKYGQVTSFSLNE